MVEIKELKSITLRSSKLFSLSERFKMFVVIDQATLVQVPWPAIMGPDKSLPGWGGAEQQGCLIHHLVPAGVPGTSAAL